MKNMYLLFAFLILTIGMSGALPGTPLAQGSAADIRSKSVERDRIVEIQTLLSVLGYRPGAADGVAGRRTIQAILLFERSKGLPSTGRPTEQLVRQLRQAVAPPPPETAPPPEQAARPPPAPAPSPVRPADPTPVSDSHAASPLPDTLWRMKDESGAEIILQFAKDGRFRGITNARFWRWERSGSSITMSYDNGWGGRIVRHGTIADNAMTGEAESFNDEKATGKKWRWSAVRLSGEENGSVFERSGSPTPQPGREAPPR